MNPVSSFPSRDRLSVLTATLALAYVLSRFLDLPTRLFSITLLGSDIGLELGGVQVVLLLVAALISAGADALIRSHPAYAGENTLIHWVVPGATALVLGAGLNLLPDGPAWWGGLAGSVAFLLAVLVAEYRTVDPDDVARDTVRLALSGLILGLALVLFAVLHSYGARALVSASIGGLTASALAGRLFALRGTPWARAWVYALVVGVVCAPMIWALGYWRITPVGAALLVMVPFYVNVGVANQHFAGKLTRAVWVEYAVVGAVGLALALALA